MVDAGIFITGRDAFKELRVQSNVLCKQDPDSYVATRQFGCQASQLIIYLLRNSRFVQSILSQFFR